MEDPVFLTLPPQLRFLGLHSNVKHSFTLFFHLLFFFFSKQRMSFFFFFEPEQMKTEHLSFSQVLFIQVSGSWTSSLVNKNK